ncbi:uncharacterized protein LOC134460590 [Engraulis encrasicolus]|uniref:uncharacterized protein LOC134460590 n=1 Tax=Engraulis encrasicolus TaxID=184585 RepID=UPI002FD2A1D0
MQGIPKVTLKMKDPISLLVLLSSMCGALTESQSTWAAAEVSTQLDVYAELKELRDMVVELRVTLRHTRDELKVLEAENVSVKERLLGSETKVETMERLLQDTKAEMKNENMIERENLKKETAAKGAELTTVKSILAATETEVANLKIASEATVTALGDLKVEIVAHEQELAALKTRLAASETQEAELTAMKSRLAAAEVEVDNLEKEMRSAPKVAFSAGLTNSLDMVSGSHDLNLVFSKVITNVGQAYSSITGFFTVPVSGVYYFRFTVMDNLHSRAMSVRLNKNGRQLIWLYEYGTDGKQNYLSGGLTLQLEKGDVVNMVLPKGFRLWDNVDNRCTFSGFLLFPL